MMLLPRRFAPLLLSTTLFVRSIAAFVPNPQHPASSSAMSATQSTVYPELLVLDLDACFWDQEMYGEFGTSE